MQALLEELVVSIQLSILVVNAPCVLYASDKESIGLLSVLPHREAAFPLVAIVHLVATALLFFLQAEGRKSLRTTKEAESRINLFIM